MSLQKKLHHYYIIRLFLVSTVMALAQRQATKPAAALSQSPANPAQKDCPMDLLALFRSSTLVAAAIVGQLQ